MPMPTMPEDEDYEMEEVEIEVSKESKPGKSGYPEFMPPKGFVPPEGVEPGEPFPVVAEMQMKPDGKMCLVSVEGSAFEKEGGDEYEEEEVMMEEEMPMEAPMDERGFGDRLRDLPM